MKKVFIVKVRGWGDDEDAMENIAAFSTLKLAEKHVKQLTKQAAVDGLTDVDTDVEVMTVDA
jgi:hypothetical protein